MSKIKVRSCGMVLGPLLFLFLLFSVHIRLNFSAKTALEDRTVL